MSARHMIIGSIDPGKSGAMIRINTMTGMGFYSRMKFRKDLTSAMDTAYLTKFMKGMDCLYIEHVNSNANPNQRWSKSSVFNFGVGFGHLVAVPEVLGIDTRFVRSQTWQKEIIGELRADKNLKPKEKSRKVYGDLFPHHPLASFHDGLIDALLIGVYGIRQMGIDFDCNSLVLTKF